MTFSDNLKAVLADRGLKQVDLCKKTGISTSIMCNYILGNSEPGLSNLSAIANALNLSIDELITYTDKAKAPGYDPTLEEWKSRNEFLMNLVPVDMRPAVLSLIEATLKSRGLLDT